MFQRSLAHQRHIISQSVRNALSKESNNHYLSIFKSDHQHQHQNQQHEDEQNHHDVAIIDHQEDQTELSYAQFNDAVCETMGANEELTRLLRRMGEIMMGAHGEKISKLVDEAIAESDLLQQTEPAAAAAAAAIQQRPRSPPSKFLDFIKPRQSVDSLEEFFAANPLTEKVAELQPATRSLKSSSLPSWLSGTTGSSMHDPGLFHTLGIQNIWEKVQSVIIRIRDTMMGLVAPTHASEHDSNAASAAVSTDTEQTQQYTISRSAAVVGVTGTLLTIVCGYVLMSRLGYLGNAWISSMLGRSLRTSL